MRLAVNWVYDGIKYACTPGFPSPPSLIVTTLTVHRIHKFSIRSFILTTYSVSSKCTYWSAFEWNIISYGSLYSDSLNFIHIFRSKVWFIGLSSKSEKSGQVGWGLVVSIVLNGYLLVANVVSVLSVAASFHRHVGGNCIVTVPLRPLFPKAFLV